MPGAEVEKKKLCRVIVVGGHTRDIGKTQLVCELISAFPRANWIAGKITQYGHGVCAQNGENCGCAPREHASAFEWEVSSTSGTDTARFLAAGALQSFWLRTKQGFLAEGLPLLREAFSKSNSPAQPENIIIESNSLLSFLKPSLYVFVLDPSIADFKSSAQSMLDRADVFVFRKAMADEARGIPLWTNVPDRLLREKPSFLQREGDLLPDPLFQLTKRILDSPPAVSL